MVKLAADLTDKHIGQRIQMRRKELGMSAMELAEHVDISQQQLSRYERGTNKINVSHLVKIAVKLRTPISWFFIDCFIDIKLDDSHQGYYSTHEIELKNRFEQIWLRLNNEKRRALILFLDEYSK